MSASCRTRTAADLSPRPGRRQLELQFVARMLAPSAWRRFGRVGDVPNGCSPGTRTAPWQRACRLSRFGNLLLAGICFSVINAYSEELIFRGLLWDGGGRRSGMRGVALVAKRWRCSALAICTAIRRARSAPCWPAFSDWPWGYYGGGHADSDWQSPFTSAPTRRSSACCRGQARSAPGSDEAP